MDASRNQHATTQTAGQTEQWPRFMRAETAARYCDEVSVAAFRRKVGSVYPLPITRRGSRQKWDRLEIDAVNPRNEMQTIIDAASVL